MTLVLAKLKGTGAGGEPGGIGMDPFRANFPTYRLIAQHEPSGLAIVDVRPEDVPEDAPATPFNAQWVPDGPVQVVKLIGAIRTAWRTLIRDRYQEGYSTWEPDDAVEV